MTTEGKPKVKVTVITENSKLQAAVKQSTILPTDAVAKSKTTQTSQDPAPNTSALQKATQQCTALPQNRKVITDTADKSSEKS